MAICTSSSNFSMLDEAVGVERKSGGAGLGVRFSGAVPEARHAAELVPHLVHGGLHAGILGNNKVLVAEVPGTGFGHGNSLQAWTWLWFFACVGRLFGSLKRGFRRKVEIDALGQVILLGDVRSLDGTQGLGVLDLLTFASPSGCADQVGGSPLQGVEHEPSALVVDAIVGEGVEHLHERVLHGVHVFEDGKVDAAGFAATAGLGRLHAAGANVEVEVTEALAAKGGRVAVDAIFLEMVTGRVGRKASEKPATPVAFSYQLSGSALMQGRLSYQPSVR